MTITKQINVSIPEPLRNSVNAYGKKQGMTQQDAVISLLQIALGHNKGNGAPLPQRVQSQPLAPIAGHSEYDQLAMRLWLLDQRLSQVKGKNLQVPAPEASLALAIDGFADRIKAIEDATSESELDRAKAEILSLRSKNMKLQKQVQTLLDIEDEPEPELAPADPVEPEPAQ